MAGIGDYSVLADAPMSIYSAPSPIDTYQMAPVAAAPVIQNQGLPPMDGANAGATPLGFNLGTANMALGGIQSLGNMWMSFQAMKQAKKQFKFGKQMTRINLANQIKAYNTALADRARSRAVVEGQSPEQAQAYFDSNALKQLPNQTPGGFGGGSYAASLSSTGTAPSSSGSPVTGTSPSTGGGNNGTVANQLRGFSRLSRRQDEDPNG